MTPRRFWATDTDALARSRPLHGTHGHDPESDCPLCLGDREYRGRACPACTSEERPTR